MTPDNSRSSGAGTAGTCPPSRPHWHADRSGRTRTGANRGPGRVCPGPSGSRSTFPNNHLSYALTWYGLAVVLLVIYILFSFRVRQQQALIPIRHIAAATAVLVYALIVLGAVVRTTNSGLSCPDWPTCYGHWVPLPGDSRPCPNIGYSYGQVMLEWVHRLIAGVLVGPLVLVAGRNDLPAAPRNGPGLPCRGGSRAPAGRPGRPGRTHRARPATAPGRWRSISAMRSWSSPWPCASYAGRGRTAAAGYRLFVPAVLAWCWRCSP